MLDVFSKGTVIGARETAEYYNKLAEKRIFKAMRKSFVPTSVTYYFQKHSFLVPIFDEKIRYFIAAGLLEFWAKPLQSFYTLDDEIANGVQPKVLSFAHIEGIFTVVITLYLVSVTIFILELLSQRCRILRKLFQ